MSSNPMIGEIMLFGGNFAIRGWATCEGQLLPIASNTALFSILGTTYGGDGRTTFGLPDLRGRVAIGSGGGPGLAPRRLGEKAGTPTNTINVSQMPSHNHGVARARLRANTAAGNTNNPQGAFPANSGNLDNEYSGATNTTMANNSVQGAINNAGGGQPVNNVMPVLGLTYLIATQGVYPSRS